MLRDHDGIPTLWEVAIQARVGLMHDQQHFAGGGYGGGYGGEGRPQGTPSLPAPGLSNVALRCAP